MGKGATRSAEFRNLAGSPRPRDTAYYKGAAAATSTDWVPGSDRALSGTSRDDVLRFLRVRPSSAGTLQLQRRKRCWLTSGLQPKSESERTPGRRPENL